MAKKIGKKVGNVIIMDKGNYKSKAFRFAIDSYEKGQKLETGPMVIDTPEKALKLWHELTKEA